MHIIVHGKEKTFYINLKQKKYINLATKETLNRNQHVRHRIIIRTEHYYNLESIAYYVG